MLFFARYEASQLGSISIETEHLLLGTRYDLVLLLPHEEPHTRMADRVQRALQERFAIALDRASGA